MPDIVIGLHDVEKSYTLGEATIHALSGVNLEIKAGEFVAVMGPSGSGKSTLLQLMGALDRPTSGTVAIDGRNVGELSDSELARVRGARIGFVFQAFNLYPTLNAIENIELPMVTIGRPRPGRRPRSQELLAAVGLSDRGRHMPNQLSGGQRQRLAVARALANAPAYLLADEPTGNLDSKAGHDVLELLEQVNRAGTTLIIVTHDPNVGKRARRCVRLLDGRIVEDVRQTPEA
ncbi:MAG: ABC transporter ATP-binding protein [Thermoplasmatota archaeon]